MVSMPTCTKLDLINYAFIVIFEFGTFVIRYIKNWLISSLNQTTIEKLLASVMVMAVMVIS